MGRLEYVQINREGYFKIADVDKLRPFFMSIVSDSNHWMFISSNGGLTAGRKNAQFALFPYYSDDKITEATETTGCKSIFQVEKDGDKHVWEPFSDRYYGLQNITRNLYKNRYGNAILFEEINHDLELRFRYQWQPSNSYGFVRKAWLKNTGSSEIAVSLLDGIQNILPYGVGSELQLKQSNLVDAYKRNELLQESGLGIYALSAIIVDRAEPSEALKANIAWSLGFDNPKNLISPRQVPAFRMGGAINEEQDVKAEKGAYFLQKELLLKPGSEAQWMIVANVNQDQSAVAQIADTIKKDPDLGEKVEADIQRGTRNLIALSAASDGLQLTDDTLKDSRHFSNTLFNIMRGGIFDNNYQIEKWDFSTYLKNANRKVFQNSTTVLGPLPETFSLNALKKVINNSDDPDFKRLATEYLPLKFSRRHGDPSRPWNIFSINTRSEVDGSKILDYQGNWRDIFQNWEALAHAYPEFIEGMIFKFLNASTFDGYNPYRVTKNGFDWETVEPEDPWSYIGYWGDHQIIYLLKFLEFAEDHMPGRLAEYFDQELFVYANVPYTIKVYEDLLINPKDTIGFNEDLDRLIRQKREEFGADGALLSSKKDAVYKVNFLEKIIATLLAKLSNFIPEGGIWLNTQRPEWNDANNALVGNGVSMVTLYYIRRFLNFFESLLTQSENTSFLLSTELESFFTGVSGTLNAHRGALSGKIEDSTRKKILDGLGQAASLYRSQIYAKGFSGEKKAVKREDLIAFTKHYLAYCDHTIAANLREDGMYHAYNLMTLENDKEISISYLSEMLEGQVAVLSSGYLSSNQALSVLDGLKASALFREDQYSYILYPNKELPRFMEKNNLPAEAVLKSDLLKALIAKGDRSIVVQDVDGTYHFNGNFRNATDLAAALKALEASDLPLNEASSTEVLNLFETVFNHKAFTGRSGTFFGYEGLGSIYWHMVSKLLLAVQECCEQAIEEKADAETIGRLLEHFYEIYEGIGVHKSPELYGAFPTDPYSHTPAGKGAQQPGMTGQVKEDILSRYGELGVGVKQGRLHFKPTLLRAEEFVSNPTSFDYVDVTGQERKIEVPEGSLCFTYCQVPVIYRIGEQNEILLEDTEGEASKIATSEIDIENSRNIFNRSGQIKSILVTVLRSDLR